MALRAARVAEVETPAQGLLTTDESAFSLNRAAPAQTLVPLDDLTALLARAHATLRRDALEFKLAAHENAALARAALRERRRAEEHELRERHFNMRERQRQAAARAEFELSQRIADDQRAGRPALALDALPPP